MRTVLTTASHLSREERKAVIATGRKALDAAGFTSEPILAGTGGGSAATTIELAHDAKEAGATHSIVICPGKFPKLQEGKKANKKATLPSRWAATVPPSSPSLTPSWTSPPCP
jgi:dihydrodipicolinate synthase/N-acetylneuraminate lyase